ncbi:MAG TPA: polysaccharide deacetylase family protein, partial [Bauldia sp.]|nr:polysaccharide deacetylase family protein [Bauldia sp.]
MANRRQSIIRAGLETLYYSGMHHVARPFLSGVGAILTFHRVRPALADPFQPNRILEITPEFLDEVLTRLEQSGTEVISLDEVHRRLIEGRTTRRFVALTFDDGYRDNREYALPILARHNMPFTLFLPSDFAEGRGELWWVALERAIAENDRVEVVISDIPQTFDCATSEAKQVA